ncbi:fluoride efflux transporter CrcB [Jeotgalibacillus proteolyticus]|uniref:Fluoride-specific ion channel FluC n=1 Tax=Jeotgalibacillus proteolyticus TaxID=2082395 RepID=A0A2S5GCW0_9BACL|nr:fluoride efflux transporter CrcB [Jeotgalibacillus proteolyticus]PPA70788.1 fluoride efflux transporter CrcB [Jeotgalibacillus proteolyticus]
MNLLWLSIGGAIGAVSRYLIGQAIQNKFPSPSLPFAMIIVNLLGSFGLGLFFSLLYGRLPLNAYEDPLYLFAGIGFFGAFTTFSTFSVEMVQLLRNRSYKKGAVYFFLSILGSIMVFLFGFWGGGASAY